MSIKAHELPDLVAAVVKKAVAEKQITDQNLSALLHKPFTIGLVPFPQQEAAKVATERLTLPPHTFGFVLDNLGELRNLESLKTIPSLEK
jgi:hypothetical protein